MGLLLSLVSRKPPIGKCQLCGATKPLCRAHIIPRRYWWRITQQDRKLWQFDPAKQEFAKKPHQTGPYDTGILCSACDTAIGNYDEYSYKVLPPEFDPKRVESVSWMPAQRAPGWSNIYNVGQIDVTRFKKFLVSLTWRAAITSNRMFGCVQLGPYKDRFRDILLGTDTETLKLVGAFLILYQPPELADIIWQPSKIRFGEDGAKVNCMLFYLPPWKIHVKIDQRPFCSPFDDVTISDGRSVVALIQDNFSRGDVERIQKIRSNMLAAGNTP